LINSWGLVFKDNSFSLSMTVFANIEQTKKIIQKIIYFAKFI
jgi:hypothetical protein